MSWRVFLSLLVLWGTEVQEGGGERSGNRRGNVVMWQVSGSLFYCTRREARSAGVPLGEVRLVQRAVVMRDLVVVGGGGRRTRGILAETCVNFALSSNVMAWHVTI